MVVIDKGKCTGCGSCVNVCHEHCVALVDKKVEISLKACSTCTQCIAICPEKALSWDGVQPIDFDKALLPSAAELGELLLERRTTRDFTDQPIDRPTLERLVSWGAYAPTHNPRFRYIIVDDVEIIEAFDRAAFQFSKRIYALFFRPRAVRSLVSVAPRAWREEFNKAFPKLETVVKRGSGYASEPVALVCVVGDRRVPLSLESAQYALYNIALFAQVSSLGCRSLVGNQMIFNRSHRVRKLLGLKRDERIFAVAGLGHPRVRFRNKVLGKDVKIQWNGNPVRKENVCK